MQEVNNFFTFGYLSACHFLHFPLLNSHDFTDTIDKDLLDQLRVVKVRVDLNVKNSRLDLGIRQDIHQQDSRKVRHSNITDLAGADKVLHGSPGLVDRDGVLLHVAPLGRVEHLKGDILKRDGEVDQVEVNVLQAEVLQRASECQRDVFLVVVGVPELHFGYSFQC